MGANFLKHPNAEPDNVIEFPTYKPEPLEVISDAVVSPRVWQKILALNDIENPTIELGRE